jgi:hypothetical protein
MAGALKPLWRELVPQARWSDFGQDIQGMAQGLSHQFESVEGADGGQHMGGIGPLAPTRFEPPTRLALLQEDFQQASLGASSDQPSAERREDGVIKPWITEWQAQENLPIKTSADGLCGLAIRKALHKLPDRHQGQAPGSCGGLPRRGKRSAKR